MKKIFPIIIGLSLLLYPGFCQAAGTFFNDTIITEMNGLAKDVAGNGGYSVDTGSNIGSIIAQVLVGFYAVLGIVFLIYIILAGFKYMNARGDDQKTQQALDQIRHAVIGLIIILAAYSITWFVFTYLSWGGGAPYYRV